MYSRGSYVVVYDAAVARFNMDLCNPANLRGVRLEPPPLHDQSVRWYTPCEYISLNIEKFGKSDNK